MAACRRLVCGQCGFSVEAWDEGWPYLNGPTGEKEYYFHPDPRRDECTGNDFPHLCLACGADFRVDSNSSADRCPQCGSADTCNSFELAGQTCPACHKGTFGIDPDFICIS